ncbi:hypothetical protein GCM10027275_03690 [Rhabdobacter roseus]
MIFSILIIIYTLREEGPTWQLTTLPGVFWLSTLAVTLSSVTLHEANRAFQTEEFALYRTGMACTFFLGILFAILQVTGWVVLKQEGLIMRNNPAVGFVYLLSGLHLLHILGGLYFLGKCFREALINKTYVDAFVYSVNPPNRLKLKLITTYWHFVDVLWLALFLFLLFQTA